MTASVAHLWRHPIKSHGREELSEVRLHEGQTMPWDRHWAVAHQAAKTDGGEWAACANFSRGAKAPALMAISTRLDETTRRVTLTHPDRDPLDFAPDDSPPEFFDWVRPLMPDDRAASARIVTGPRGMTDSEFASVSIMTLATHRAVEAAVGKPLSKVRWRGNIWLDGPAAWSEFDWIGRTLRIGTAELEVRERITRCMATTANPDTGQRDADTLGALQSGWNHRDFGVYGVVTKGGQVRLGDAAVLL
jgi:uncharacterized protein